MNLCFFFALERSVSVFGECFFLRMLVRGMDFGSSPFFVSVGESFSVFPVLEWP